MAIAKKPQRNRSEGIPLASDKAAEAFIAKVEHTQEEPPEHHRKTPIMVRFDRALLKRVDEAAKHRGISRSAWIQFTVSRALDQGEG
jgi:predicted HicB family RNase H-like nuclease